MSEYQNPSSPPGEPATDADAPLRRRVPGSILERRGTPSGSTLSVTFIVLMLALIAIGAFASFQFRAMQHTIETLQDNQAKMEERLSVVEGLLYAQIDKSDSGSVASKPATSRPTGERGNAAKPASSAAANSKPTGVPRGGAVAPSATAPSPAMSAAASALPAASAAAPSPAPAASSATATRPASPAPADTATSDRFRDPLKVVLAVSGVVALNGAPGQAGGEEDASLPGLLVSYVVKSTDGEGIWGISRNFLKHHYKISHPTGSQIQLYADTIVYYNVKKSGKKPREFDSLIPGETILIPEFKP